MDLVTEYRFERVRANDIYSSVMRRRAPTATVEVEIGRLEHAETAVAEVLGTDARRTHWFVAATLPCLTGVGLCTKHVAAVPERWCVRLRVEPEEGRSAVIAAWGRATWKAEGGAS